MEDLLCLSLTSECCDVCFPTLLDMSLFREKDSNWHLL